MKGKIAAIIMLSDQTAPNTQFLKCYKEYNPDYIFITTVKMEENHISDWIIKGAGIADEKGRSG